MIIKAISQKREAILKELRSEEDDVVSKLRSLRINGNYSQASPDLFEVLLALHEGGTIQQNYAEKAYKKIVKAQKILNETAQFIK